MCAECEAEATDTQTHPGERERKFKQTHTQMDQCELIQVISRSFTVLSASLQVDLSVDLLDVAKETDGFSGSDLREMCRDAALLCVRDFVHMQSDRYLSGCLRICLSWTLATSVKTALQHHTETIYVPLSLSPFQPVRGLHPSHQSVGSREVH